MTKTKSKLAHGRQPNLSEPDDINSSNYYTSASEDMQQIVSARPRMRTIAGAAAYLRELDPDTAITESLLRGKVLSGQLPCVTVGVTQKKRLVDLNIIEAYLRGELAEQRAQVQSTGIVRPIDGKIS